MNRLHKIAYLLLLGTFSVFVATVQSQSDDSTAVSATLDALHENAAKADGKAYFALVTEDAVFLGTDATERWSVAEFKKYAMARFDAGTGWTYHNSSRYIYLSEDKKTAWFDETLTNENYGDCRGSGVLVKTGDAWKIAQYNLTIPIPNDLARKVVTMIREQEKKLP